MNLKDLSDDLIATAEEILNLDKTQKPTTDIDKSDGRDDEKDDISEVSAKTKMNNPAIVPSPYELKQLEKPSRSFKARERWDNLRRLSPRKVNIIQGFATSDLLAFERGTNRLLGQALQRKDISFTPLGIELLKKHNLYEGISLGADEIAGNSAVGCRTEIDTPKHVDVLVDITPLEGKREYRLLIQYATNLRGEIFPPVGTPGAATLDDLEILIQAQDHPHVDIILLAINSAKNPPSKDPRFSASEKKEDITN